MSPETEDQNIPPSTNLDSKDLTEEEIAASDETSLEDDWAAALAEQSQAEAEPPVAEDTTSASKTEAQPETVSQSSSDEEEPPSTDASLENDWAAVLEDQEQPQPEAQQAETAPTENDPASDDSSQVVMGWPNSGSGQSQQDPTPAEWKPTRITPASEHDQPADSSSPEEQLAASAASSAKPEHSTAPESSNMPGTSPPPELSLAAAAAEISIQVVMERATDVSEVIQDEQAREQLEASGPASDTSPTQPTTASATSDNLAEAATAPKTPELDQGTHHPEPPPPDIPAQNIEQAPDQFRRPFFTGTGGSLFGMFTMNTLLTLLTFGVYSFWARIKIRRYLHSQTKFAGARLAFHGTGGELLKGWMKAVVVFGIPYSALSYAGTVQTDAMLQWGVNILAGLFILCFIPIAIVGSHRYRMSRTSWRGIYFSFRNSAKDFFTLYLKGMLFSILTLGIYYPVFDNAKRAFLVSGTYFGNRAFGFDGEAKELGSIYFKAFRLLILGLITAEAVLLATSFLAGQANPNQVIDIVFWTTIAMILMVVPFVIGNWFWFQATKQRYMWNHTTFGPARFHATMTGKGLFELKLTNLFLLIGTLGLAWPWVQTRNLQFLYYHVGLQGPLNLKQVVQEAGTASPMGEELAGFFDTGFDLG